MKRLLRVLTIEDWKKKDKQALKGVPEIHKDIEEMMKKNTELLQIKGGK